MTVLDILQLWAKHTEYNPEQYQFALGSTEFEFNRCGKIMTILNSEYDPSGVLSVLYAKTCYRQIMSACKVKLFQIIENPGSIDEYLEMWRAFESDAVREAEDVLISAFNKIISTFSNAKLIGEGDREEDLKALYSSIEAVTECLHKCNVESFMSSGLPLGDLERVSSTIEIFPTLAQCLLTLERRPDGIYICYISHYGAAGGFFGFYLKSNGNIISINDRIDESYVGQHGNSRNGRWSDAALFDLFPYEELLDFSQHDYKGYATKWTVKKSEGGEEDPGEDIREFPLKDLKQKSYMSLILAIILLMRKYSNQDVSNVRKMLVDSLLQKNLDLLEATTNCYALALRNESAIVKSVNEWSPNMTTNEVLSGELNARFHSRDNQDKMISYNGRIINYNDFGYYSGVQQIFVDLYGEGFSLDASKLLYAPDRLLITDGGEIEMRQKEFIGTEQKMALECYRQARQQLREYIEDQMVKEYTDFGGHAAVKEWYIDLIRKNSDKIIQMAVDAYIGTQNGAVHNYSPSPWAISCSKTANVCVESKQTHYASRDFVLNKPYEVKYARLNTAEKWICPITGTTANIWITFFPNTAEEIERIFGCEVPKILKGWSQTGAEYGGNSILDSCDAVAFIKHPYQITNRHPEKYAGLQRMDFHFTVGLSKRGLNQLLKARE